MSELLKGVDVDQLVHVERVSEALTGMPSAVSRAVVRLHFEDGSSRLAEISFRDAMIYETNAGDVDRLNVWLGGRRGRYSSGREDSST